MLQRVYTRVSKGVARYSDRGSMAEHCSACRFFMSGGDCARVLGRVLPQGWCKFFSQEAVQREYRPIWPMEGIPAPGGASLSLDFLTTPGTLDPRITFTRASTATYFNSAGVMHTAPANIPRWDYDPATLALRGLLIEEARTNIWLQSADASNAAWQAGGIVVAAPTVTANQAVAPDGTLTAARVAFPAVAGAGAQSGFIQSLGATANPFTFSVWMKGAVGGEQIAICATPDAASWYRTVASLTTSWKRFSLTTPNLTAATWYFEIGTDLRDPGQTSKPAQTINVWGAQVEQGAFVTSYIATAAAAATRAIDVCYMPVGSWFTPAQYSLLFEFDLPVVSATYAYGGISDSSFGANTSYFTNSGFVTSGGTANAVPALVAGATNKQCAAVNPSTFNKLSNNGGAVTTTAISMAPQSGATRLAFGNDPWALATAFNGHVRRVMVWPRILSAAEMQQATT